MKTIDLIYKHKRIERKETLSIASSWNELTLKQLLYVGKSWEIYRQLMLEGKSLMHAKNALFLFLTQQDHPRTQNRILATLKKVSAEDLYDLVQNVNFIFDKNELTRSPIREIILGDKKFYGPPDEQSGITGFEFSWADQMYLNYHITREPKFLDLLCSCLYRPGTTGKDDPRDEFDKNYLEVYATLWSKIPMDKKQVILLFYIGCRAQLVAENPEVFTQENEQSGSEGSWIDVILEMSDGKFGNFQDTGKMDMSMIFREIKRINQSRKKR